MVALHEDVSAFITISRWILRKIRSVSDKRRGENENTHLMLGNFPPPPENRAVCEIYRKIWRSQRGPYNTGARCIQKLSIFFFHTLYLCILYDPYNKQRAWILRLLKLLRGVRWFETDVSGLPLFPISWESLALENWNNIQSRNVGFKLPYAA